MTNTRTNPTTVALMGGLLLGLAGCGGGPTDVQSGNVRFVLSAASVAPAATLDQASVIAADPGAETARSGDGHGNKHKDRDWRVPPFESANVTFSSILARNFDGVLVDVAMELPTTVDIMNVDRGREVTLPDGDLPPGMYDQIVVVMTAFQGTTEDGTVITIEPPGGGWTAIIPICPFDVEEGATAVVGLRLGVRRSFSWRNDRMHFDPHFECDEVEEEEPVEG